MRYAYKNAVTGILFALAFVAVGNAKLEDPDPERYRDEIQKFVDRDVDPEKLEGSILCVGSSSMRMWGKTLERDLKPLRVVSLGFGGSHFSDVNFFFEELVGRYSPRAILIYEGDNDTAHGKSPAWVTRDLLSFIKMVHDKDPAIRVYVISVKPSTTREPIWPLAQQTNRMMEAVCAADERLHFIDVSKNLLGPKGEMIPEYFVEDGIHLNEAGYVEWTRAIRDVIIPIERPFEGTGK